jgi:hypothetical protein
MITVLKRKFILKSFKLVFFVIITLFSCSEISVKEIKNGQHWEKADLSSVQQFLELRMENRIKKIISHNTEILAKDNNYIYYGYVKGYKYENLYVKQLFKVERSELELLFPGYDKLTGIEIRRVIDLHPEFKLNFKNIMIQDKKYSYKLSTSGLEVNLKWIYQIDNEVESQRFFQILIDPRTGIILNVTNIGIYE